MIDSLSSSLSVVETIKDCATEIPIRYQTLFHNKLQIECNNIQYLIRAFDVEEVTSAGKHNRKLRKHHAMATVGDAILKTIISEYLFDLGYLRDKITEMKKVFESNSALYEFALKYSFQEYLYIGFLRESNKEVDSDHFPSGKLALATTLEALIFAIYRTNGFDYTKRWIIEHYLKYC